MSAERHAARGNANGATNPPPEHVASTDDEEEDEEDDDEPRLKYTTLTANLPSVYRNGDATSTVLVAGDRMVMGTHNGNIHVLSIPSLQPLRLYHAHSASVTALSVSPMPPPPQATRTDRASTRATQETQTHLRAPSPSTKSVQTAPTPRAPKQQPLLPATPNNSIYIASASIDGHVCVSSLVDPNDVTLRNFARPIQAVALSPDFKADRTYLSGGLSGNLILTVGGKAGVSADANTNSAAAAASGWLGSIGLGSKTGKDTVLHSGEGSISCIKFSTTGKYVAWVNEHGIKIMRSHLKLDSVDADSAWKRFAHVDRPGGKNWDDMAGVWKGRAEWINDTNLETDEEDAVLSNGDAAKNTAKTGPHVVKRRPEKLVVGWGDTAWVLHVHAGRRSVGTADFVHKLTFDDCVISGLSLYTPSLLAVLAYRTRDDDDKPVPSTRDPTPTRGRKHRQTGLKPELRLINAVSRDEVDVDTLNVGRFETLSAADYHLGTLFIPPAQQPTPAQRGAFETLGAGFWETGSSATRIFSSGASVRSATSSMDNGRPSALSPASGSLRDAKAPTPAKKLSDVDPSVGIAGLKLFICSPYDCVLAVKRDLSDHLDWLLKHHKYSTAWDLLDKNPGIITSPSDRPSISSAPSTPSKAPHQGSLADFFGDDIASQKTLSTSRAQESAASKEKRRIGDMWLQQLVATNDWAAAGKIAGKVLGTSSRWEHWVLAFAHADRFDEVTPYIPSTDLKPPLPSFVYEVILGHYVGQDRPRLRRLLEQWDPELFDITSVSAAIENQLDTGDVREDTIEDGEQGRDWRILLDSLAKLQLAGGKAKDALRCHIRLQNADAAMALIRDYNLLDAIQDDIPGLLLLRVSKEQLNTSNLEELAEASSEVVQLLVDEAQSGVVQPETVVDQLETKGSAYHPFLFFYFRALWQGKVLDQDRPISRVERLANERKTADGQLVVEQFADLAITLFAEYDRDLLMTFLRHSNAYTLDKASAICETRQYIPELVYLLSKTGQTRSALFLIIGKLGDVSQAIAFAKDHPDLWDDLLDYSMDKPPFIRALLAEVGTAIDPIQLIRRIPNGLEIDGLKEGLQHMVREYDIQYSISDGVARVFRGEVAAGMDTLRAGQKRAVKFEVRQQVAGEVEVKVDAVVSQLAADVDASKKLGLSDDTVSKDTRAAPGHCVGCDDVFAEDEHDFLVGFACGHVFHLGCLLDYLHASAADHALVENLASQTSSDGDDGSAGGAIFTRSVGAKIAHAQVIRSAIKGGCPVCVAVAGAE